MQNGSKMAAAVRLLRNIVMDFKYGAFLGGINLRSKVPMTP